ncbi:hypothetical protein [Salinispora arenicola]|uniref:hypothetical protein n=1 Tax=Salinispora arenicola TaxID=168697 RepID=UPI000363D675|nr:hypothetical protein [Salinispora arenicola]
MESPEEQERRKITTVVELGLIAETVSAMQALTSEEPSLTVGLLALILLLVVSRTSQQQ